LLKKKNKFYSYLIPRPVVKYLEKVTNDLKNEGYETKPLNVGDRVPNVVLINHLGDDVELKSLIDDRPVILNFYRGAWCPYCNLELSFYDELLGEEENKNIRMLAISPEKPDITLKKIDIGNLNFKVLSDVNNTFSKKMKLVFQIPKKLKIIYRFMGINLNKSQGNDNSELPIPATYVVNSEMKITHAWIDADYTKRAEPSEVIKAIKSLL
jgi:peroxiredoxin